MLLNFLQRLALGFRQEKGGSDEINHRAAGKDEEHRGVAILTDGRQKNSAMVVEIAMLTSSATLMPLERMRVGINSDSASQTQTPGPTAKNAMKQ